MKLIDYHRLVVSLIGEARLHTHRAVPGDPLFDINMTTACVLASIAKALTDAVDYDADEPSPPIVPPSQPEGII